MTEVDPYPAKEHFYRKFSASNGELVKMASDGGPEVLAEFLGKIGLFDETAGFAIDDYDCITNTIVRNSTHSQGSIYNPRKIARNVLTMFAIESEHSGDNETREWARKRLWRDGGIKGKFSSALMIVRSVTDLGDRTDLEAL